RTRRAANHGGGRRIISLFAGLARDWVVPLSWASPRARRRGAPHGRPFVYACCAAGSSKPALGRLRAAPAPLRGYPGASTSRGHPGARPLTARCAGLGAPHKDRLAGPPRSPPEMAPPSIVATALADALLAGAATPRAIAARWAQ